MNVLWLMFPPTYILTFSSLLHDFIFIFLILGSQASHQHQSHIPNTKTRLHCVVLNQLIKSIPFAKKINITSLGLKSSKSFWSFLFCILIICYLHKTFFIVLVVKGYHIVKGLRSHFSFYVVVVATNYCCVVDYHFIKLIIITLGF